MKKIHVTQTSKFQVSLRWAISICIVLSLSLSSCGGGTTIGCLFNLPSCVSTQVDPITQVINNAVDEIEQTRQTIESMSSGWQTELTQLQTNLGTLEGNSVADVHGILNQTIYSVNQLEVNTGAMLNDLEGNTSAYIFCHEDDLKTEVLDQLLSLENNLLFWKKNRTTPTPQKAQQKVCVITPGVIQLYPTQTGSEINTNKEKDVVNIYGYNFDQQSNLTVSLQQPAGNTSGSTSPDFSSTVTFKTAYEVDLNFNNFDFGRPADQSKLVLTWPDGSQNSIPVELKIPAQLVFSNLTATTSPLIMGKSVSFSLVVTNIGGEPSQPETLKLDSGIPTNISPIPYKIIPLDSILPGAPPVTLNFSDLFEYPNLGTYQVKASLVDGAATPVTLSLTVESNIAYDCKFSASPNPTLPWTVIYPDCPGLPKTKFHMLPPELLLQPGWLVKIYHVQGCVRFQSDRDKRYADPDLRDDNDRYYGTIALPGTLDESAMTRITDFMKNNPNGLPVVSPYNSLEIGYVDDGYGDNSLSDFTDLGDDNQCVNQGPATVTFEITVLR